MVRTQGSAPDDNAIESEVQAVTETFAAGEQQQSGISFDDARKHGRYIN